MKSLWLTIRVEKVVALVIRVEKVVMKLYDYLSVTHARLGLF